MNEYHILKKLYPNLKTDRQVAEASVLCKLIEENPELTKEDLAILANILKNLARGHRNERGE